MFDYKSNRMYTVYMHSLFLYIFALHVSGTICTHPQEHKLQSAALGVCNLWQAEVIIVSSGVEFFYFIFMN
jgi:hypothetical protein